MMSFRRRIEHSTLALIVVLLVGFDAAVYWGFQKVLYQYVDSRLFAMAESWADIAARNLELLLDAAKKGQEAPMSSAVAGKGRQIEMREAALSIEILSLEGDVLWKGAAVVTTPPGAALLEKVASGEKVFETLNDREGASIRRVWVPIRYGNETRYILQAETPLRLMGQALQGLLAILAVASAAILTLAWLGSRWLARQALMPIEVLSATAQKITEPTALATRLVLDAPYTEFRRLAQAFNTMMERIEKVVESQRRFVADAAHEIQTPLTALKGNLEVAFRRHRSAEEYRETLVNNLAVVERLINLCRSLITLAKLAGEDVAAQVERVNLEALLRELVEELSVLATDRQLDLQLRVTGQAWIKGNKEQLQRVFINLLDNAFRHTGVGGVVRVIVEPQGPTVAITVSDTGEGIEAVHLAHIFDRFYRVDSARSRRSGGIGLGLAIVREIVEAHRGSIQVTSTPGVGTVFTITLPVLIAEVASGADGQESGLQRSVAERRIRARRSSAEVKDPSAVRAVVARGGESQNQPGRVE